MTEWKTIDSAPRDQSEFLAYDPVSGCMDVCSSSADGIWIGSTQFDGEYGPCDEEFNSYRATHWMPLPPPPTAE